MKAEPRLRLKLTSPGLDLVDCGYIKAEPRLRLKPFNFIVNFDT